MRKARTAFLLSIVVPLAGALPVITPPSAVARAVTPEVRSYALRGVEPSDGARSLRRSLTVARQARAAVPMADQGQEAGEPEVLASRTGVEPFKLLGVTWRGGSAAEKRKLTVLVRTHSDDGWTAWQALDTAPPASPTEADTARGGTEPLWTGESDGYEVRVDVRRGSLPRGLRVDLIEPGTSAADETPGGRAPMQSASAASSQPVIYSRAQWGADERLRREAPSYNATIKAGFVHHTAGSNNYTADEVPQILRAIYAYHVKGNGWSDIGYNFLVDKFGRIWEGRAGGIDRAVLGAHTGGFNVDSFAVSAIGNYDKTAVPAVTIDSISRVLAWKLGSYFRDPNATTTLTSQGGGTSRYAAGTRVRVDVVAGHRDVGKTTCPGANIYSQMSTIRQQTTSYLGTTMYDPSLSAGAVTYGTGSSVTATARVNSDQAWQLVVRAACREQVVRTLSGTATPLAPLSAWWDLRDESGAEVRPGAYVLSLVSSDANGSSNTWSTSVTVNPAATSPPSGAVAPSYGRTGFVPVDPIRLYDTRADGNMPLGPKQRISLRVPGVGKVPNDGVAAVALNISTACSSSTTRVFAWPTGMDRPKTAALNSPAGTAASAMAVSALGGNGEVMLKNWRGTTELAVHVVGYYPTEGGSVFRQSRPIRLYDSRQDPAGPLAAGAERTITVPTLAGVPATSMTGVLLNVTARKMQGPGHLTVQSVDSGREAATVAYSPGRPVKNRAVAKLDGGAFKVSASDATADVVVDLVGWWAPAELVRGRLYQPKAAARVLDTRKGIGADRERVGPNDVIRVRVAGRNRPVPGSARAVVMNLTAVDATQSTYVTAWPQGRRRPAFPDLSVPALRTTSNLVVVKVGKKNQIKLTNGRGWTHLVGEIVGYYP